MLRLRDGMQIFMTMAIGDIIAVEASDTEDNDCMSVYAPWSQLCEKFRAVFGHGDDWILFFERYECRHEEEARGRHSHWSLGTANVVRAEGRAWRHHGRLGRRDSP